MTRLLSRTSFLLAVAVTLFAAAQENPATPKAPAPAPVVRAAEGELPEKVIDRMKVPITAKFTLPLERALHEIFGAVDVKCFVDGIALKSSGITKNEVQKLNLEQKPVHEVIQAILDRSDRTQTYPDVVLVIDEEKKLVTVTTKADAQAKRLTPVDFEQLRKK